MCHLCEFFLALNLFFELISPVKCGVRAVAVWFVCRFAAAAKNSSIANLVGGAIFSLDAYASSHP